MWAKIILVFVIFHSLSAASADGVRSKRDLIRIKKFFTSLLGLSFLQNDEDQPIYENPELYIQNLPGRSIDGYYNEKTGSLIGYRGDVNTAVYHNGNIDEQYIYPYREVDTKRFTYPIMEQRDIFETPVLPTVRRINAHKDVVLTNQPNNERQPERCVTTESCVTLENTRSLLQSPLYVQNQVRQILPILKSAAPEIDLSRSQVNMHNDKINIHKYLFQRMPINQKEIVNLQPLKIPESSEMNEKQYEQDAVNSKQISEAVKRNTMKSNTNGIVTFSKPVPSRFVYKQIYQSDPSKNSAFIVDNEPTITSKIPEVEKTEEPKSLGTILTNQINQPLDSEKIGDYPTLPSNYMFIPPESIGDKLAGTPLDSVNNPTYNFKADNTASGSQITSLKTKPIVVFDEAQNNNIRQAGTKMRIVKRLKSKLPVRDNIRGDIPES